MRYKITKYITIYKLYITKVYDYKVQNIEKKRNYKRNRSPKEIAENYSLYVYTDNSSLQTFSNNLDSPVTNKVKNEKNRERVSVKK